MFKYLRLKSLRTKIALTFILIVVIVGIINSLLGIKLIGEHIIKQAQSHVQADLNSAHEIYRDSEDQVLHTIRFTANRFFMKEAAKLKDKTPVLVELRRVSRSEHLDFISLTDRYGRVILRTGNQHQIGDNASRYNAVNMCILHKMSVAGTELFSIDDLLMEDSSLTKVARVPIQPTPRAKFQREGIETTGMVLCAASPIFDQRENLIAVLYGGRLINNNFEIVDKIKNTVFLGEKYEGRDIGTATIFMKDLRISTNVMKEDGTRAIGTLISKEVYEAVVEKGLFWIDRAFVVNEWYITAYQPIRNINDEIIGVLYVGVLESRYTDIRNQIVFIFTVITLLSMFVVFGFSYVLANNITKPLRQIAGAAKKIAQGDFPDHISLKTDDEISDLGKAIQFMITALRQRDEQLKESISKTVAETERLATVGQLAAGVAHEINNPLTGILLYCDLVLQSMEKNNPDRANLEKINKEAKRCKNIVKGLLDFSRPKKPEIAETSLDGLLDETLSLIRNQALFHNIKIIKESDPSLPHVEIDPHQIQQVVMNLLINAAEAMHGNGTLTIRAHISPDKRSAVMAFSDTGPGISPKNIGKVFEPFFTTKDTTHGVGLGLAISQRIIRHHGGTMEVISEQDKGATFMITLPIH